MTRRSCARLWQAEAARDGRLSSFASASFGQHCQSCGPCRDAVQAQSVFAQALRDADPYIDQVSLRRLRGGLLRSADELLTSGVSVRLPRWRLAGLLAAGCVGLSLGGMLYIRSKDVSHSRGAAEGTAASAISTMDVPKSSLSHAPLVEAAPGTSWSRHSSPSFDELVLSEGTLSIDVPMAPASTTGATRPTLGRVILRVPDGQILDLGTRFRVSVQQRRTQSIQVSEGAVLFLRPGEEEVRVEHGTTWSAREPMQKLEAASATVSRMKQGSGKARSTATSAPEPRSTNLPESRDAVLQEAEDAAYLSWISLQRAGRHAEARRSGRDYLDRFPNGFRRAEVEATLRPSWSHPAPPHAPP